MSDIAPAYLWLIGGMLLMITELVMPGYFLIWVGAAAVIVGGIALALGLSVPLQFVLFAVVVVGTIAFARRYMPYHAGESPDPMLNNRTARLIGEVVMVEEGITATGGRVRVGDSIWLARGPDAAPGTQVKITGAEGNTLIVETV